jgi:hypothetical protein
MIVNTAILVNRLTGIDLSERITYYCQSCGRKRLGPLASEANSLNSPCDCGGPLHWAPWKPKYTEIDADTWDGSQ